MPTLRLVGLVALAVGGLARAPQFAGAQSASTWILLEKYFTMKNGAGTTTWEPQDGFDFLADCRMSAQQLLQTALAFMKTGAGDSLDPCNWTGERPPSRSRNREFSRRLMSGICASWGPSTRGRGLDGSALAARGERTRSPDRRC